MPPRILPRAPAKAIFSLRLYSTSTEPLIRTTLLPAPGSGHIRIIELNRPKARNAISKALLASLRAEVDDIRTQYGPNGEENPVVKRFGGEVVNEKGPTRALIIASAVDASFCAGADLKERRGFTQQE